MENKVKKIVAEWSDFEVENIKNDSDFIDALGCDSMDVVEIVMALEEEFDIVIEDESMQKFDTVDDVLVYLKSRGGHLV